MAIRWEYESIDGLLIAFPESVRAEYHKYLSIASQSKERENSAYWEGKAVAVAETVALYNDVTWLYAQTALAKKG